MTEFLYGLLLVGIVALMIYGMYVVDKAIKEQVVSTGYNCMKQYYSVPMKPAEIQEVLLNSAAWGEWKSEYLPQENTLLFHHYSGLGGTRRFFVCFTDMGDFSVISVGQFPGGLRGVSVDLDGFFTRKLNAVSIPNEVMRPHS